MSIKVCEWCKNHIYASQDSYHEYGFGVDFCTKSCRDAWRAAHADEIEARKIRLASQPSCISMILFGIGCWSIAFGILFVLQKIPEIPNIILGIIALAGLAAPFLGSYLIPEDKKRWVVMTGGIVVVFLILNQCFGILPQKF